MYNKSPTLFIKKLQKICGSSYILTNEWNKESYCKGWRYGNGKAALVIRPGSLIELWKTLEMQWEKPEYKVLPSNNNMCVASENCNTSQCKNTWNRRDG